MNIENVSEEQRKEYLTNFKSKVEERTKLVQSAYDVLKENKERSGSEILIIDLYNEFYHILEKWSEKVFDYYN